MGFSNFKFFQFFLKMSVFTHSDYIGNLVSSSTAGALAIRKFELNPGLASVFPWVAPQIVQYYNYRVVGCRIKYEPNVGTSNSTAADSTVGRVGIRFQSDPTAPKSSSLLELENAGDKVVGKSYMACAKTAGPNRTPSSGAQLRVRVGGASDDLRFYDFGYFEVWSEGIPSANVVLGKLRIEYSFECSNTIMYGGLFGKAVLEDKWNIGTFTGTTNPFECFKSSTAVKVSGSNLGCNLSPNGQEIWFPSSLVTGKFKVIGTFKMSGAGRIMNGGYGTAPKQRVFSGNSVCQMVKDSYLPANMDTDGYGLEVFSPQLYTATSFDTIQFEFTVLINNPNGYGPSVTSKLNLGTGPGTNCSGTLHVIQVNSDIL